MNVSKNITFNIILSAVIFILIVGALLFFNRGIPNAYLSAVNRHLILLEEITEDPLFILQIEEARSVNNELNKQQIFSIDRNWILLQSNLNLTKEILNNDLSKLLIEFREENSQFIEIFVTDDIGLNVGMTNITSDYYQADEGWWSLAMSDGIFFDEIEFDDSARYWGVPLYIPIINKSQEIIGVMKAIVDIDELMRRN